MPRKKQGVAHVAGSQRFDSNSKVLRGEFKWLNVRLEPKDIEELERSDSTLEFLAASLCGLASDGYGFSIKPTDQGKSYCVTIHRPDSDDSGVTYGMSSFGGELRDALLVALYKFDVCLEGSFDDIGQFLETSKPQQRFR